MKKKYIQNTINLIVFFICTCMLFIGNGIMLDLSNAKDNLKENIETEWRQQTVRSLIAARDQFQDDLSAGLVDPHNEYSLQEWAKRNISHLRNGGGTGDGFVVNLENEKFIWDGSPDCARERFITDGRYLKDEPELHQDPKQAEYIVNEMRTCSSTLETNDRYWWNFDGSPEYLEWTTVPTGVNGFDSEPPTIGGIKNHKCFKVLIALGTQQDEVESTFQNEFKMIDSTYSKVELFIIISIAMCVFNLILYIFLNKRSNK